MGCMLSTEKIEMGNVVVAFPSLQLNERKYKKKSRVSICIKGKKVEFSKILVIFVQTID